MWTNRVSNPVGLIEFSVSYVRELLSPSVFLHISTHQSHGIEFLCINMSKRTMVNLLTSDLSNRLRSLYSINLDNARGLPWECCWHVLAVLSGKIPCVNLYHTRSFLQSLLIRKPSSLRVAHDFRPLPKIPHCCPCRVCLSPRLILSGHYVSSPPVSVTHQLANTTVSIWKENCTFKQMSCNIYCYGISYRQ